MKHKHKKKNGNSHCNDSMHRYNEKHSLDYYMQNFHEVCERCGEPLSVIKHRPKSHNHREVVAAVCMNKNYKGNPFHCDLYQVEIRFIEKFVF